MTLGERYRGALRHRDMRLLVTAFVVDGLGGWAYFSVLVAYVYERSGSTTWVAATTASRWIPGLLLSSVGGVIADRYERTRVMVVSAMLSAAAMALMTAVVTTDGPLVLLLALSAVSATVYQPFQPAFGALTPDVVRERELAAANALYSALDSLTIILGPAIGGVILLTGSPSAALALNTLSFVAAAALVSRVRTRSHGEGHAGERVLRQLADGLAVVRRQRVAAILILFCALDSAVYGAAMVLYAPLSEHLGTGSEGYSYLRAGTAVGGLVAASLADRASRSARLAPVILGGILLQSIPFALTVPVHSAPIAFLLQAVSGAGMVFVDVLAITALQRDVSRGMLGRVLALLHTAVYAAILLSSFLFASVYSSRGLTSSLLTVGVIFPVLAVLGIAPVVRADRRAAATVRALAPRARMLESLDLFAAASYPTLERLAAAMDEQAVPAGAALIREGEPAEALYVLVEGSVDVTARIDGEEQFLRTMHAPAYVGEIGLLTNGIRTATVTARDALTVWRLPGQEFLDALQEGRASASLTRTSASRLARTRTGTDEDPAASVGSSTDS